MESLKTRGAVKSVQSGNFEDRVDGTISIPINPVDVNKSALWLIDTGFNRASTAEIPSCAQYRLYSNRIEVVAEDAYVYVSWHVVEFY